MKPTARCTSCNAPIVWAFTSTGKRMPVNPDPVVGGNVVLLTGNQQPEAQVLGAAEVARRAALGLLCHTSHFATCPQADAHRRPQPAGKR